MSSTNVQAPVLGELLRNINTIQQLVDVKWNITLKKIILYQKDFPFQFFLKTRKTLETASLKSGKDI